MTAPGSPEHERTLQYLQEWIRGEVYDSLMGPSSPGWVVDEYPLTAVQGLPTVVAAGGTVQLSPQYAGVERITSLIAVVAAPATAGLITLGARNIPIGVGITNLTGVLIELTVDDVRQLTITGGPANAYLELMGYNVPGTGAGAVRTLR